MPLDPIKLDDLTWSEMVLAIRKRIAAASGGKWTLHAPVDPGLTLLELFAWLLEQRLYWMDQIPDSLVRGALSLLGEGLKPTQVAATVMRFATPENSKLLPKMTELEMFRSNPPIVFSTEKEIVLLPFERLNERHDRISLIINGEDRTTDLEEAKVLRLFPADGVTAEVKIIFWLRELLPAAVAGKRFSLLFDLRHSSGIPPQWSPEAPPKVPPPAKLSWFYSGANDKQIPFADEVDDGTGGLRRSGLMTLPIKTDWLPASGGPGAKLYQYAIWVRVEAATFTAPPRLERLIPNVAIAWHRRRTVEHLLKRDWLPLPNNTIALADLPETAVLKDYPPIENTIELKIKERDDTEYLPWKLTSDLTFHGPDERVFVIDRQRGELSFGDGLTGRLPVLARSNVGQIKVQYCVGGGIAGKLGANLKWQNTHLQAINVVPTEGGEEPETISAVQERVASALSKRTRAITQKDYEELARTTPGVAIGRAHAAIGFHPAHPCMPVPGAVTVFIVPDAPRPDILSTESAEFEGTQVESAFVAAPIPDPGTLSAVFDRLNERRLVASELFVLPARFRPLSLTIEIESNPVDRTGISQLIERRLRTFLDPLIGGEGDGWPFGEQVRPSAILREAQLALGDQGNVTGVLIELLGGTKPDQRIDQIADGVNSDCATLRHVGHGQNESYAAAALGAREAAEFRDRCRSVLVQSDQAETEQSCFDVPIGAHELVEIRQLITNFREANENQGGLT
jgi:hypothetical protein